MIRVIVFGSRNWPREYEYYIAQQLGKLPPDALVVHGACPTGADAAADFYARERGLEVERHVANWRELGRSAGPRRNAHMASLGASQAIGFRMPGKSDGTDNMAAEAELARIPVQRHGWDWPDRW